MVFIISVGQNDFVSFVGVEYRLVVTRNPHLEFSHEIVCVAHNFEFKMKLYVYRSYKTKICLLQFPRTTEKHFRGKAYTNFLDFSFRSLPLK